MKFIHVYIILILFQSGNGTSNFTHNVLYRPFSRIIGGRAAWIYKYPSTACLILKGPEGDDFRGGAVIISEYWAVTAAHCMVYISDDDVMDNMAFIRSNTSTWTQNYSNHLIIERHVHENYNHSITDYDIAALKVKKPFNGRYEKPAKLPRNSFKYAENSVATVLGWGTTDAEALEPFVVERLRYVNITIFNHNTCKSIFKKLDEQITNRMMCASSPGKDACVYDSGGPLFQNGYLIGLVSWGSSKCGNDKIPGVYTKISYFYPWLMQKIGSKEFVNK